jgi:putative sigma-54 modulation protein
MLLNTHARGLTLGAPVKMAVNDLLNGAFERFADRVHEVNVVVEDVNGPRGGEDKRVRLEVRGARRQHVLVEGRGADVLPTLGQVVERATRALARGFDRRKPVRLPR